MANIQQRRALLEQKRALEERLVLQRRGGAVKLVEVTTAQIQAVDNQIRALDAQAPVKTTPKPGGITSPRNPTSLTPEQRAALDTTDQVAVAQQNAYDKMAQFYNNQASILTAQSNQQASIYDRILADQESARQLEEARAGQTVQTQLDNRARQAVQTNLQSKITSQRRRFASQQSSPTPYSIFY
jgi:hypothetical protein